MTISVNLVSLGPIKYICIGGGRRRQHINVNPTKKICLRKFITINGPSSFVYVYMGVLIMYTNIQLSN